MGADRSSTDDFRALSTLSTDPLFSLLINRTADNSNGTVAHEIGRSLGFISIDGRNR